MHVNFNFVIQQVWKFIYIYLYYLKNDLSKCLPFIDYMKFSYPGSPAGYLMTVEYYSMFELNESTIKIIVDNYFKALFLTDYDENIYNNLRSFLDKNQKADIIKQLEFMYSKSKRGK